MAKGDRKLVDRLFERFGNLLVIDRAKSVASGAAWMCRCDCGAIISVAASNLKRGQTSCFECASAAKREDLTGKKFGRLTAVSFAGSKLSKPRWLCVCECGSETIVVAGSLTAGNTQSCGCLGIERRTQSVVTHGMTKHPLYDAWVNMKQRCQNEAHKHYSRYGGRGIRVCERWESFQAFADDMQPTWVKGLTLEREDVNGHYEPSNCTWVTRQQQAQNKEKTIKVELDGQTYTLPELAEKYSINQHSLWNRWKVGKRGSDLVKPVRKKRE